MNRLALSILISVVFAFVSIPNCLAQDELVLMSHDSFSVSAEVVAAFESENDIKLRFMKAGDTGIMLNQAILSKNNPMADLIFGIDNTHLSRALNEDLFISYRSSLLEKIPNNLKLDPKFRMLPVDYGDVCLNYDKKWFADKGLTPPNSLEDLIKPAYDGLTVVQNPSTSSPGLAFLLATIGRFGEDNYLDYWKKLREARVLVVNGWSSAYYEHFTSSGKGTRPIVVSYASSPPVEVIFASTKLDEAPTAAVVSGQSCFRQVEFVGILKGTKKQAMAKKLIDYMLSVSFQEDIPLQMYMYPANKDAELPEVYVKHAKKVQYPVMVRPALIEEKGDKWKEDWTETVLR